MNTCIVCGKPKGRNKYFCSHQCSAAHKQNKKQCVVCGKSFNDSKSNHTVCCSSPVCRREHRQQMQKDGVYDHSNERFNQGRITYFAEHVGEKHHGAKHWVIKSPDGQVYECDNLKHFVRENIDLFDGTVRQVYDGIVKIKAGRQGKRKRPANTYKDWELISWNDAPSNKKYSERLSQDGEKN